MNNSTGQARPPKPPKASYWFYAEFLGDTLALSPLEFGVFVRLVMHQGKLGLEGLPSDEHKLQRMAGCSKAEWKRVREAVLERFHPYPGGKLFNPETLEMTKFSIEKIEKNTANARERWKKHVAAALQSASDGTATHPHPPHHHNHHPHPHPSSPSTSEATQVGDILRLGL